MISMAYDLAKLPILNLVGVSGADLVAMARKSAVSGRARWQDRLLRGQGGRQRRAATREASEAIG